MPASEVMEEEDLHAWRYLAFYASQGVDVPKEEQTTAPSYTPEAAPTPENLKVLTRTESKFGGIVPSSRPNLFTSVVPSCRPNLSMIILFRHRKAITMTS